VEGAVWATAGVVPKPAAIRAIAIVGTVNCTFNFPNDTKALMRVAAQLRCCLFTLVLPALAAAQPLNRVVLHAHNCFPEAGRWADRLDRALATGVLPIAIEQDLGWTVDPKTGAGRSVLSHGDPVTGREPTLEEHFFTRVRPIVDRLLVENRRETWPAIYLHFNIRNNDPAHLEALWALLGRYEAWLTTAEKTADETRVMPLSPGPLMVLTEGGQESTFYDAVPVGGRLRVFGTAAAGRASGADDDDRRRRSAALPPDLLIPNRATNYRRWINFSWAAIEAGGQPNAGEWSAADAERLRSVVARAHGQGLWVRFYTLNGHAASESQGWSDGYNFGSLEAARQRWRAAIAAGVDFIAVDQYERLAEELRQRRR
jgi:hypothetical protein